MTHRRAPLNRVLWWLDTTTGLAAMFILAFLLRVAIAPHVGFYGDLKYFRQWASVLAQVGPRHFYSSAGFADYPPGYLYILWVVGKIHSTPGYLLLKLPAIIADLGLAWIVGTIAQRIAPVELNRRLPVRALVAGGAILFNPAIIALSVVWGQVDAVPAAFVLWALLLLYTGPQSLRREIAAFLVFAVAIAMKPQEGFVLPVMLYALYRRYLHGRSSSEVFDGLLAIGLIGALSLSLWAVSGLPFGLSPSGLVHFYGNSASEYPVTSANAFNLWGVIGFWHTDVSGAHGIANFGPVWTFAGIPALYIGWLLFIAGTAVVLWRMHRALDHGVNEARAYMAASAALGVLSFVVLTRMHERYLFLGLVCAAPLVIAKRLRWAFIALSVLFFLNLWWPFTDINLGWHLQAFHIQPIFNWLYGGLATNSWQRRVLSLALTATGLTVAWFGGHWVEEDRPESAGPTLSRSEGRKLAVAAGPAVPAAARGQGSTRSKSRQTTSEKRVRGEQRLSLPKAQNGATTAAQTREPQTSNGHGTVSGLEVDEAPPRPSPFAFLGRLTDATGVPAAELVSSRWGYIGPFSIVALVCGWGLWVLRGETQPAANLNDSAFHLQMVDWASGQIHEGRIPLDGWFPDLSLGSSFFHHYQSLAEIVTAYTAYVTGMGNQTAYDWFLYLLLALWPLSIYWSARLFGWNRWTAAAAAAISPLIVSAPGYGYEHGSYTWQGYGVYSQEWAMWLLPLAWGYTWRAVAHGKRYAAAGLALALTMACHFITGYVGILTVGVWVIVASGSFLHRVSRGALAAVGSVVIAAWVLVPLIVDTKYTTQSEYYKGTFFNDSYGAKKILGWLVSGKLLDAGRFPVITLLLLVGAAVCISRVRWDPRARALLGAFLLSLFLFFGRVTWGRLIDLLPGMKDIQIQRFEMGVDLAAILIAGVGLSWLLRQVSVRVIKLPSRYAIPAATLLTVLLTVGVLAPAWTGRGTYDERDTTLIRGQQLADSTDGADLDKLIAIVKKRDDGRVYAGLRSNWGKSYTIGSVPVYAYLTAAQVDSIGFTFRTIESLSTDVEASFDETNPAQYQMLNIKYVMVPAGQKPAVPAKLIASSGRHRLYEVDTTGYFQVVDREGSVTANRTDLEQQTRAWRNTDLASRAIYPSVAFAGAKSPPPTFSGANPPAGKPGSVISQSAELDNGSFTATVEANRPAEVLLKATYDPRWRVTVDGVRTTPTMMAPSLVGVEVPAGRHVIRFHYQPVSDYPLLFAIGAIALLGLVAVGRGWIGKWPDRSRVAG